MTAQINNTIVSCISAGVLVRLHVDDPVSAGGVLHPGGLHPDDSVGQGEASQLPQGVPRLPTSALAHPALCFIDNPPLLTFLQQGAAELLFPLCTLELITMTWNGLKSFPLFLFVM